MADPSAIAVEMPEATMNAQWKALTEKAGAQNEAVTAIVDLAKSEGMNAVAEFGLMALVEAAAKNKKKPLMREGAMMVLTALVESMGRLAEPFVAPMAHLPLALVADRHKGTAAQAVKAVDAMRTLLRTTPSAAVSVMPAIQAALEDVGTKWQTKVAALDWVVDLTKAAPVQLGVHLTQLVPVLTELLHDLHDKVSAAAKVAANAACGVVDNRDLQPFLPSLVDAMEMPAEVPETIHKLASLTFVQSVETPALAVVVPLLHRGMKGRHTALTRECAVIVSNMSKLVDDPSDAAPFLPSILPAMERAADETTDPEARAVCVKARDQLLRISAAAEAKASHPKADAAAVLAMLTEEVKARLAAPAPAAAPIAATGGAGTGAGYSSDSEEADDPAVERAPAAVAAAATKGLTPEAAVAQRLPELTYIAGLCATLASVRVFAATAWNASIVPYLSAMAILPSADAMAAAATIRAKCAEMATFKEDEEEDDADLEDLCDVNFTLAYGTRILLHNTQLKLKRGARYGLLGGNNSGKSTLLRAIAGGQIEGLPTDQKYVCVEADIQGEMSHLCCLDYVFADEAIKAAGIERTKVQETMEGVGFTSKMCGDPVTSLSGGWRMKLALARAMLQNADVLLMDEPTNHLDVLNVAWVEDYLCSLKDVTSIIVSHNAGLLDKCCTHMLEIEDLKLNLYHGNLSRFRERFPSKARAFFELASETLSFSFPEPGPLEGVTSKGKVLMKMDKVGFTYPGNPKPTLTDITVRVSLSSRVACVGVNGAGKSTMIKLLTGELTPDAGTVWCHPSARIAYVAQHAFHHIEKHLEKTATQYIMWRFGNGEDKEALRKEGLVLTDAEVAKVKTPIQFTREIDGVSKKVKLVVKELEDRRKPKRGVENEYKATFEGMPPDMHEWMDGGLLRRLGFEKVMKACDSRCMARERMYKQPLTTGNVEKHIANVGLAPEVATHTRMGSLSGGEKVKVVLAACTWFQPHILILDEPTNYLDRDSLGALAGAIREYEGGVVMITHNDAFCSALCPETWVLERKDDGIGHLDCRGDAEWMANALKEKVEFKAMETMVDAAGNETKMKTKKKLTRKQQKERKKRIAAAKAAGLEYNSDDEDWEEWEATL